MTDKTEKDIESSNLLKRVHIKFRRAKFLFSICSNQVALEKKKLFLITLPKTLAKIQEFKLQGTSAERNYANRRMLKTLPRVSLTEE